MQTIHCEKCQLLFNDALQGELSTEMQEFFAAHLKECRECSSLYEDYKKLSFIISQTPPISLPSDFRIDLNKACAAKKKFQRQKTTRQWLSIAAVFLVFIGSYAVYERQDFENQDNMLTYTKEEGAATENEIESLNDASYGVAECPPRSESRGFYCEPFEDALSDPVFFAEIQGADLGFGYELLECNQEEDGSTTFVIYFYEDELYTAPSTDQMSDLLSLSNVRSFHWKKTESSL